MSTSTLEAPPRARGLGPVVRSGVSRRWVQTVVMVLATAAAVTSGVLGCGLLVASNAPFDHGFAQQHGAHLIAEFAPTKATTAQLTASAHATGVTASAGPFPTAPIVFKDPIGGKQPAMTLVGRAKAGGPVDAVSLTAGRWPTGPNEIVLSASGHIMMPIGSTLQADAPGNPSVTLVGVARSVSGTADGWMTPAGLTALHAPTGYQMLYRFAHADTAKEMSADRAAVTKTVPSGALIGSRSWLTTKKGATDRTALFVPFLLGFGGLALVLSVLVIGTVIAGAVGTGIRRIGILKALGFTPGQVVRAYLGQALIPATIGTVAGLVVGNLLAIPLLAKTEAIYGTASLTIAPWVDVVVGIAALAVVAVTAGAASARAGRLRAVDALTVGRTPTAGRGQFAARMAARMRIPRPLSLGLVRPFSAPGRAVTMIVAIAIGAAAVTLSVGVAASFNRIQTEVEQTKIDLTLDASSGSSEDPGEPPPPNAPVTTADPAKVATALDKQPGTAHYYGLLDTEATIAGLSGTAQLKLVTSNPAWSGYELVSGRWFTRPGEAVVATELLRATDRHVGDTLTTTTSGHSSTFRIVGEVFDPDDDGHNLIAQAPAGTRPSSYQVGLTAGTDRTAYATALAATVKPLGLQAHLAGNDGPAELVILVDSLATFLTLLMVTVAGLGVLNAVVLDVRDRVHDIGVHKALGMTPRQTLTSVLASVVLVGLAGGAVGVPAGMALHGILIPAMGHGAGTEIPPAALAVYRPLTLAALALGGLVLAVAGAFLPAGWAAKTRTATALRTE